MTLNQQKLQSIQFFLLLFSLFVCVFAHIKIQKKKKQVTAITIVLPFLHTHAWGHLLVVSFWCLQISIINSYAYFVWPSFFPAFELRSHKIPLCKRYTHAPKISSKRRDFYSPTHTYAFPTTLYKSMYDDNEHKEDNNHLILLSCTAVQHTMTTTAANTERWLFIFVCSKERANDNNIQRMENMFTYISSVYILAFFGTHATENLSKKSSNIPRVQPRHSRFS